MNAQRTAEAEMEKDGGIERPRTKSTKEGKSTEDVESTEEVESAAAIESTSRTSARHPVNKGKGTFKVPSKPKSKNLNSLRKFKGISHSTNHSSQDDGEVSISDSDDDISLSELRKKYRGKSQTSNTASMSNTNGTGGTTMSTSAGTSEMLALMQLMLQQSREQAEKLENDRKEQAEN